MQLNTLLTTRSRRFNYNTMVVQFKINSVSLLTEGGGGVDNFKNSDDLKKRITKK